MALNKTALQSLGFISFIFGITLDLQELIGGLQKIILKAGMQLSMEFPDWWGNSTGFCVFSGFPGDYYEGASTDLYFHGEFVPGLSNNETITVDTELTYCVFSDYRP